jgi:hypothetical protein
MVRASALLVSCTDFPIVERILKQQREEREAAAEVARQARPQSTALVSDTSSVTSSAVAMPGGFDDEKPVVPVATKPTLPQPLPAAAPAKDSPTTLVSDSPESKALTAQTRPQSGIAQWGNNLKKRFSKGDGLSGLSSGSPSAGAGLLPSSGAGPSQPSGHVTPLTNISETFLFDLSAVTEVLPDANIQNAIKACRPETRGLMRNREHMQQVKESMNEGYCDVSGRAGDLVHVGTVGEIKVFAAPDVPEIATLVALKKDALARFIAVIRALGRVYALPPTSLHIFYDVAGSLIAFNAGGSLFCNLRYYEAWRASCSHSQLRSFLMKLP